MPTSITNDALHDTPRKSRIRSRHRRAGRTWIPLFVRSTAVPLLASGKSATHGFSFTLFCCGYAPAEIQAVGAGSFAFAQFRPGTIAINELVFEAARVIDKSIPGHSVAGLAIPRAPCEWESAARRCALKAAAGQTGLHTVLHASAGLSTDDSPAVGFSGSKCDWHIGVAKSKVRHRGGTGEHKRNHRVDSVVLVLERGIHSERPPTSKPFTAPTSRLPPPPVHARGPQALLSKSLGWRRSQRRQMGIAPKRTRRGSSTIEPG
jgi:hypothetical protein